tara:strand:+ start:1804 stop:2052 length:249 start_codon:yes stop_codon:yes gene_type:complete
MRAVDDYPQIEALLEEITGSFLKEYDNLLRSDERQSEETIKRLLQGRQRFPIQLPDCNNYRCAQLKVDIDELTTLLPKREQQ